MGDMISTFLIGLMILAQINGHKQVPNLNFAVVASKNALPLWRKLIQTYAQNRSRHIIPAITLAMHSNVSPPSEILELNSALIADSLVHTENFSTDYLAIAFATAPLVFYYNLPEVPDNIEIVLTLFDINDIFEGKLKYWNDTRIRHKNPKLPLIQEPISLIIRDDDCRSNLALSAFLSNYSNNWKETYGTVTSLRNFKAPYNAKLYRTVSSSGEFSLLNSIPYSIAYFSALIPPFPKISIHLHNGKVANPAEFNCKSALPSSYPLISNFYAIIRKDLAAEPYNISLRHKDPLQHLSSACILQIELYRFLNWLSNSICAEQVLASFGLCQASKFSHNIREMTCLNKQNLSVQAVTLYLEEMPLGDLDETGVEYVIFTFCATAAIIIVISLIIFRHFWADHHPMWEYYIEQLDLPNDSTTLQAYSDSYRIENTVLLQYTHGSSQENSTGNSYAISKNIRKRTANTWVYADTILSTAPVHRMFKDEVVFLKPSNIPSNVRFSEKGKIKLQKYTEVDHENVSRFYGMAKSSAEKGQIMSKRLANQLKLARKTRDSGSLMAQGHSESDFVLPWIYYAILEPCTHGSLFELLHSGQYEISLPMKSTIALDIASGMAYLHSRNIVHGKLSSLTCLLNSRWVIKIARWQQGREVVEPDDAEHENYVQSVPQRYLKVSWNPDYLRLVWKSPAQLKDFIASQRSSNTSTEHHTDYTRAGKQTVTKRGHAGDRKNQMSENLEKAVEETSGIEYKSMACDVYSFGVILTEIWNLEVPFRTALTLYQSERQLAEAICNKIHQLSISINMHPKIREITECCIDHSEKQRPSFRDIFKTMASLVPKGRSLAHYMLRAAIARIKDLGSASVIREREVGLLKSQLYRRLDCLFPRIYSKRIIGGGHSVPAAIYNGILSAQNALLAVVTLDSTFLQSAANGDENLVLNELRCLKQISEKYAKDEIVRCLAAPGGFENDGVCFVAMNYGEDFESASQKDRELILRLLRVVCQVGREFNAMNKFNSVSHPKFCAVVHRSTAMWGPLGAYFPWHFVYGKVLEDILELKRFAKPMEVLVTSEVTRDIKSILRDFKDYTLADTYHIQLWGVNQMELYVLR